MFSVYGQRLRSSSSGRRGWDSPTKLGHDTVNYMHPCINYDKPPRKFRPPRRKDYDSDRELNNLPQRCYCSSLSLMQGDHNDWCDMHQMGNNNNPNSNHPKTEVFSKMFTCLGVENHQDGKHGGRYSYSALEDHSGSSAEKSQAARQNGAAATRESAASAAKTYCKSRQRYTLLDHLREIGSRIDKNWFTVKDTIVKTDRLMTLLPHDALSPVPIQQGSREALIELFQALQHPYIHPVLDLDFATVSTHSYVVIIQPANPKGTLKDLIYTSHWQDDWSDKYQQRASGLPQKQVQRLGRQVLEALLFMQDRGFPPFGHLHSGNVVLQNGVARLTGLENTLFGLTSRIYPTIKKRLRDNTDAIDSVCFGHVLFEMCAGYELSSPHPTSRHLEDIQAYPLVVKVLNYIFGCGDNYPSIEEILCCDFFRNLDLREMRAMPLPFQLSYSPAVRIILKEARRHQKLKTSPSDKELYEINDDEGRKIAYLKARLQVSETILRRRTRRTTGGEEEMVGGVADLPCNEGSTPSNSSETSTTAGLAIDDPINGLSTSHVMNHNVSMDPVTVLDHPLPVTQIHDNSNSFINPLIPNSNTNQPPKHLTSNPLQQNQPYNYYTSNNLNPTSTEPVTQSAQMQIMNNYLPSNHNSNILYHQNNQPAYAKQPSDESTSNYEHLHPRLSPSVARTVSSPHSSPHPDLDTYHTPPHSPPTPYHHYQAASSDLIGDKRSSLLHKNPYNNNYYSKDSNPSRYKESLRPDSNSNLLRPLPNSNSNLMRPLPGSNSNLMRPLPESNSNLMRPLPESNSNLMRPLPESNSNLMRPLPDSNSDIVRPLSEYFSNTKTNIPSRYRISNSDNNNKKPTHSQSAQNFARNQSFEIGNPGCSNSATISSFSSILDGRNIEKLKDDPSVSNQTYDWNKYRSYR